MGDLWLNRFVVRGPYRDVLAFVKAATPEEMKKRRRSKRAPRIDLSFRTLIATLPPEVRKGLDPEAEEPEIDFSVDGPRRITPDIAEVTYRFQLGAYEPDELLKRLSKEHPRLSFVLGWVFPAGDSQESKLFHRGRVWFYRLSNRLKKRLQANVPDGSAMDAVPGAGTYDPVLWALIEADWAMLDAVVDHWDKKSKLILRKIVTANRRRGRAHGRRRRSSPRCAFTT